MTESTVGTPGAGTGAPPPQQAAPATQGQPNAQSTTTQTQFTKRTSVTTAPAGESGSENGGDSGMQGSTGDGGSEQGDVGNAGDTSFQLPDAYKDKPWASKIKSEADLWSQIDNLQTLVGKKAVVPDFAKATPADVEAFNAQLRPADKSEYVAQLKMPETIPEADKSFYADLLHEAVVRPDIATGVLEKFGNAIEAKKLEMVSQEDFNAKATARFGKAAVAADGPIARVENEVRQHLSPDDSKIWDDMPNKYLDVTFGVINKIMEQYGAEDGINTPGGRSGGGTAADLNKRIDTVNDKLRGLSSRPHSMEEKNVLLKEVQTLNVQLAQVEASTKKRR